MNEPHHSAAVTPPGVALADSQHLENQGCDQELAEPPQWDDRLVVDVVEDDGDWSAFGDVTAAVRHAAKAVAGRTELDLDQTEATVALSCDSQVADLNGTFRGKPKPTNVLSFPAGPMPQGTAPTDFRRPLGDIILARETILAEAAELAIPAVHHLQHLVVHGLLHLLGYDHQTEDDATAMEALERDILAALDIPDPYTEPALPFRES